MHVVALAGWYPVKRSPFVGDFVQRHLCAISEVCKVTVIHINRSADTAVKASERRTSGNLNEIIINLPLRSNRLFSFLEYYVLISKELKHIRQHAPIDLLHLHVVKMNGLFALVYKLTVGLPYIITEHATAYIDGAWDKSSFLKKTLVRAVFNRASSVHCVSKYLAVQLKHKLSLQKEVVVIPNVVDTKLFFPVPSRNEVATFIHVSTLTYQKNIAHTLEAFGLLKQRGINFFLNIVGPPSPEVNDLIRQNHLENEVTCLEEMPQPQLARHMAGADALVLYSRYETFGCVIIESLACGKPVVVTDISVLRELVQPLKNGILVKPDQVDALAKALEDVALKKYPFYSEELRRDVIVRFSYPVVARQFLNWYQSLLKND